MASPQLRAPKSLLCEDSDAHTLNQLVRWYCDRLDELGDREILNSDAVAQQRHLRNNLRLPFVRILIFGLVLTDLSS